MLFIQNENITYALTAYHVHTELGIFQNEEVNRNVFILGEGEGEGQKLRENLFWEIGAECCLYPLMCQKSPDLTMWEVSALHSRQAWLEKKVD